MGSWKFLLPFLYNVPLGRVGGECKPRVSPSGLSDFKLHVNHTFISQQSVVFHSFISHYFAAIYHVLKRYPEIELVIAR